MALTLPDWRLHCAVIINLAETDEAADEYMNVVYSLCAAYERQSYVEGIKVGARLMMEMMEPVTE